MSGTLTASRVLAIVSILRAMSLFEGKVNDERIAENSNFLPLELTLAATTVISFYTVALGPCVGPNFKAPSLEYLGRCWFEASSEFH